MDLLPGADRPELSNVGDPPLWMRDALCREYPRINFFPSRGESLEPAKAICRRCLVANECDAYANALPVDIAAHGIWAGVPGRARMAARGGGRKPGPRRRVA